MFVQRNGLHDAAIIQSAAACADDINRMRLDSNVETGQSVLFRTPIVTENETLRYTCAISKRTIMLGCTRRFGGNEMLSLGPTDMVPLGRFELRTITPLVARTKTPPNPTGEAPNPYEWRQLQQQLVCLYGLLVNIRHVNALSRSINHLFALLTTDEGYLMTIPLAGDVMSRVYGSVRSKAESIITTMGCGLRCAVLDVPIVRENMRK